MSQKQALADENGKPALTDNRPIGLFDSGIGGLTVLRSLLTMFPDESFVYLGDTARLPYGSKSPETIERYLLQNIRFLSNMNVKAIVVACNSASTVLLGTTPDGHSKRKQFPIPVYNVIEPGAQAALRASTGKRIGVLGTKATIAAGSYAKAILDAEPTALVYQQACPLLVPLVEEGWEDDPLTNLVIYRYLNPIIQQGVDTLILGCTHYPALHGGIGRVAGPNVALVDSAASIAESIRSDMAAGVIGRSEKRVEFQLLTTDVSPSFAEVAARLMKPHAIPPLQAVDISQA